ncbi:MAG: nucleotidyltransferase, partial [Muribaculaceae bacterium]|nr:nucleotidyltransferase [Muribaculaceae bacterium]
DVFKRQDGFLTGVVERTSIGYDDEKNIVFTDENGNVCKLAPETPVSMNMWGFTPDYFDFSKREFKKFLDANIDNPKAEFYIPTVVDTVIKNNEATVKVLDTDSRWFGVTYAGDRQGVVDKFARLHQDGVYPSPLFKK